MKQNELLTNKAAIEVIENLLTGAKKLKDAKKYFDAMERKPDFLPENQNKDFFTYIDTIDVKIFETLEELNQCIAFVIHCELDNNINE